MKKEYKYTINGNKYEVAIGEIVDNIATLTVNGEEFKVEMEKEEKKPHPKPLPQREGCLKGFFQYWGCRGGRPRIWVRPCRR